MTDDDRDREQAKREAEEALLRAQSLQRRGRTLVRGWRTSRADNNFRQMIRNLGVGGQQNG
jgi:hypothetical protein